MSLQLGVVWGVEVVLAQLYSGVTNQETNVNKYPTDLQVWIFWT